MFIFNVLPVGVTVCVCFTIQTAKVTIIGRPQGEGVLKESRTPEGYPFRRFNFTLSNLNI